MPAVNARVRSGRPGRLRSLGWRRLTLLGILTIILLFFVSLGVLYAFARIPEPNDIAAAQSVVVLDHNGKEVGRIHSEADRVSIRLNDMPAVLRQAVIATEDRRFYSHPGVAVTSIARAALSNLVGRQQQGGSTITQQYVKNAYVGNRRSVARKVKEAVIALKLERQHSKDDILERYLNTIYFGRGAYGCEAAAQAYFSKHAKDLTLPQAALLAGLIRSPEAYDPAHDEEAALSRRNLVLGFMVRDGYVSEKQAKRARKTKIATRSRRPGGVAPHFLDDVRRELEEKLGARQLFEGGITVTSTLDLEMQRAADDAVRSVYDRKSDPEAALVAIDPHTGAVRAMVGARDYGRRQLNIATQGHRQPGSTFKPAVLATWADEGRSIKDRFKAPAKKTFDTDSGPWPVENYDHDDHGTLTVEKATWLSVNTVYAQMILKADPAKAAREAERLGIDSKLDPVPSLTLGTSDVTPLELTDMYATLAARGEHHEPYMIETVKQRGRVIFDHDQKSDHAVERNVADTVNHVLKGVIERGTGKRARIDRPAAGKTGTTESHRDAWFAGYTPELAAVVWNGYPGKSKTLENVRGIDVVGGTFPAEMWRRFMEKAVQGLPATDFATPEIPKPSLSPSPSKSPSPSATPSPTVPPSETPTVSRSPTPSPTPTRTKTKGPKPTASSSPSPSPSPS